MQSGESETSELRQRAESKLTAMHEPSPELSPCNSCTQIQELRTHQIELEMQNEALRQSEQALTEARDHAAELYDFSPIGYVTLSNKGVILRANLTLAAMLGIERAILIGKPFSAFVGDSAAFGEYLRRSTQGSAQTTIDIKGKSGVFFAQLTAKPADSVEFNSKVVSLAITDISLYRLSQQALAHALQILENDKTKHNLHALQVAIELRTKELLENESKFKLLFQTSPDPTWIIDENNIFILCNDAAASMLAYDNAEALQSTHPSKLSPEYQPDGQNSMNKATEMMACARRKGIHRFEWVHKRNDGSCFPVEVTLSSISINRKDCLYCEWRDISERKMIESTLQKLNRELEFSSLHDGLTDIANRRMFDTRLHMEWGRCLREQLPVALIMVDIDYFKQYNDTYGHLAGDECLKRVAKGLSEVAKRNVDLCARYGGEEFALLLPNTNLMQAVMLAEQCLKNIYGLNIQHKNSTICDVVTISAGVASIVPDQETQASFLIQAADEALYRAKDQGRNRLITNHRQSNPCVIQRP